MPSNVRKEVITREYYPDLGGGGTTRQIAAQGQKGDDRLAHVNRFEEELLKRLGGAGTVNPRTGLKQFYWDGFSWYPDEAITQPTAPATTNPATITKAYTPYVAGTGQVRTDVQPTSSGGEEAYPEYSPDSSSGYNMDFPTNIMPTSSSSSSSYSGLPTPYRDDLLKALMPRLQSSITEMEPNIDKYVSEALGAYQQAMQNALRINVPKSLTNLSNRGILNSTEGQKTLSKVYSDAATDASTKGYNTAMEAALLKANMPTVLAAIAELGKYSSSESQSKTEDPTKMYSIIASMLAGQF